MRPFLLTCLLSAVCLSQPTAIVVDGPGPWSTPQWTFAVGQFTSLLSDAGYTVKTVSPVDLPAALINLDVVLAVPSLETLPFQTSKAINSYMNAGGSLLASGGAPFRNHLYRAPDGQWLDADAYLQAVGSKPTQETSQPYIPTVASFNIEQYTNSAGLRVPLGRWRGLLLSNGGGARYRVVGDLLAPSATIYVDSVSVPTPGQGFSFRRAEMFVAWLPSPQLPEPLRAELVAALRAVPYRVVINAAGADRFAWFTGEKVTGGAYITNLSTSSVQISVEQSLSGPSGVTTLPTSDLTLASGNQQTVPIQFDNLPNGNYTVHFRLMIGGQEVDHTDSPFRVLNPTLTRQPEQKIRVVDGAFTVGGKPIFLRGINYWPRYGGGYDPDVTEADLTQIAALKFNLLSIQYGDYDGPGIESGSALVDFLERCRNHGLWVEVALRASSTNSAYAGQARPTLESQLNSAYLAGNDRVFAYDLLWEPSIGTHDKGGQGRLIDGRFYPNSGRTVLDPEWRAWINDQYGSADKAQNAWSFTAPVDDKGQLTNPLDEQMQNDGPWRIMVAAYRRFMEDYLGRNLGALVRQIQRSDPEALFTYRNWATMTEAHNANTGYDLGTGAAHLDFVSPERYSIPVWPKSRASGLVTAYGRYRTGNKPVMWAEFGWNIGLNGGTPASRAMQNAICDAMMRQVQEDGSQGAAVWWWPGGIPTLENGDFGMIDPDGTPRPCLRTLAQWNATYAATPPYLATKPAETLTVDRDLDARGSYGLFLNFQDRYVQHAHAGKAVTLADAGTNTDTSTMPRVQVGNVPHTGIGPLKFANAEFAGIHIVCPNIDATIENGGSFVLTPGTQCQITPTLVNTGEARWRNVILHTNVGDQPVASLASLQRTAVGPLSFTAGQAALTVSGRMSIPGTGDFGELLNLKFEVYGVVCPASVSPAAPISVPAAGGSGTLTLVAPPGVECSWIVKGDQPWLSFSQSQGTGSATVTYTVPPAYGPKRQATIRVATYALSLTQDGVATSTVGSPTVSVQSLNFGARTLGSPSTPQTIQLTNAGPGPLNLQPPTIGGSASADFTETNNCGSTLLVGQQCSVQVTFVPTTSGTRTASLYFSGNIADGAIPIALSGTGVVTGPVPTIAAIVDAWGYTSGIAPGLWVTIGGTNLAGPPQTWNVSWTDQLPVTLSQTTVTFNGTPAALLYVSSTQINALVPANIAPGNVDVIVNANGVPSAPFKITAQSAHPAVYAPPTPDGASFNVTAALAGTATLIGNSATDPRVIRPAYPGDILDLYMIGLGSTRDPSKFITDQIFSGAYDLSAPITATIGSKPATVVFAGLTSPGLYLVRVQVPSDLSAGPQPLQVSAGGIETRSSLLLQISLPPR